MMTVSVVEMRSNALAPAHFPPATNARVFAMVTPTLVPVNEPGPISAKKILPSRGSKPDSVIRARHTSLAFIFEGRSPEKSRTLFSEKTATDAMGELVLNAKITASRIVESW